MPNSFILYVVLLGCAILEADFVHHDFGYHHGDHHGNGRYTNKWVIQLSDDHPDTPGKVSDDLGLFYHGTVGSMRHLHVVEHQGVSSGEKQTADEHHRMITSHQKVVYARQERMLSRKKRGTLHGVIDPMFAQQWFLNNNGQTKLICDKLYDINVEEVWKSGITGKGVLVAILDDGLEYTHTDLRRNYNSQGSYNYNSRPFSKDPAPRETQENLNKHGTRCAGEVAAERDNGKCGRGVAYNAQVSGIKMLDGEVSDSIEAGSLSYARDIIDIYSSSWGPDDDGSTVDGPGPLTRKTLKQGVMYGRNGLGSIFVWATGNGGGLYDYCSCDGYINSPYTISIGAVNNCGKKPWYSELCPGTIAVTFSSGNPNRDLQIVTTDLRDGCTTMHTGTSAAAPLAAGIFALVLEANPLVSWRDMQHLIVHSSRKVSPSDPQWQRNGAGLLVNEKFGFGALDAKRLVDIAQDPGWITASKLMTHITRRKVVNLFYVRRNIRSLYSQVRFDPDVSKVCINKLEHVHAIISLRLARSRYMMDREQRTNRGQHSITLTSPSGTVSRLLAQRPRDHSSFADDYAFKEWEFMTVFNWDEDPKGTWTLKVTDHAGADWSRKPHFSWRLKLSGTCQKTKNYKDPASVWWPQPKGVTRMNRGEENNRETSQATSIDGDRIIDTKISNEGEQKKKRDERT